VVQILAIDGNNIGYASMYTPALSRLSHDGQPTGGILGLVQSVIRIAKRYPEAVPIVLWDGHAAWRKELCPEYKENRRDRPDKVAVAESWKRQQPWANLFLLQMGVLQMRAPDAEADDLAGRLAFAHERFADFGIDGMTLVSGDTDWWQALSRHVTWFTPITDGEMTLADLQTDKAKDGPFSGTEEYLLAKAMAGDPSDNIPGVQRVGIPTALKLLRLHEGLDGIAAAVASGRAKDKASAAIVDAIDLIERNRRIMDWRLAPPSAETTGIARLSFSPDDCRDLCAHFGFDRLAHRLEPGGEWDTLQRSFLPEVPAAFDFAEFTA